MLERHPMQNKRFSTVTKRNTIQKTRVIEREDLSKLVEG